MAIFDIPLENLRRRRSIKWARFAPDVLPMFVAEMDAKPVPAVVAHATALTDGRDWLAEASAEIRENKQHFADELHRAIPELTYTPSQGTYLAWLDCSPLGLGHAGQHFFEKAKVRFGQGTDYAPSATQFVRVNLATSKEIISEAVRRMAASL